MKTDALIIGTGLAGLTLALRLAEAGKNVLLTTKTHMEEANSAMAQGGIAAVLSGSDSFENHVEDTLRAGAGLCRRPVVEQVVSLGPEMIRMLMEWGVQFDLDEEAKLALTREGGHSQRRIVHIADHTGQAIHERVRELVRNHPRVTILENRFALDLITTRLVDPFGLVPSRCLGAYVLNKENGEVSVIRSGATFLASGGAGKVYLYTSNWSGATGDGVAMAARAGARVANLEFTQFHPTCLYHPNARNFLISEALRGEGAELVGPDGLEFMSRYHELGSLAPRDIVARSIDAEMKKRGLDCVYLDITTARSGLSTADLRARFPQIYSKCAELGVWMERDPIPVVPAAHYMCGGVLAKLNGRTDIGGLYAVGEVACTGLHGANRLASNSLLECLVMAALAAADFLKSGAGAGVPRAEAGAGGGRGDGFGDDDYKIPEWPQSQKEDADELIVVTHMWDEIRRLMWNYMGIVRTTRRLERAQNRLDLIAGEIREYYSSFRTHQDIEELRNIALVAELSVRCALMRQESRGIHFSLDYPETADEAVDSVI